MAELPKQYLDWENPCEGCQTNRFNYSDLDGGVKYLMDEILGGCKLGYQPSSGLEKSDEGISSLRVEAALSCARRIVGGECPDYVFTGPFYVRQELQRRQSIAP